MIITVSLVKYPLPHIVLFFPTQPSLPPTLNPTPPLALSKCPLYMFLDDPSLFSPHYPLLLPF